MFCKVYRLRDAAGKLSREAAGATVQEAWLEFGRNRVGSPEHFAWLRNAKGVEIAILTAASIRFIRGGGIMIRGFQTVVRHGGDTFFSQSWWCVPADPAVAATTAPASLPRPDFKVPDSFAVSP